ncbi:MAG: polysaccharide biosynthesis/export family protein [Xanthobacteraceae bacterium]|jgi:polysaccharide export outer membrane protein
MLTATLLMVCVACLGGCGSSSSSTSTAFAATPAAEAAAKLTSVATPGNSAYKIGPLDVLDVSVFKVPDLTKTVQVADDGTINYPLVGEIPAAGKTAHQLERDLMQKLGGKYLRSPQVSVFVREYNSQRVTVEGSVKTTGIFALKGRTSLIQMVAMAGGIDTTVASGDVVVFRTIDGKRSAARFDVEAIKKGEAEDPEVEPGDVVVIDTSSTKVALNNVLRFLPLATSAAVFAPLM